ncbi:MAG: TolC family protein [Armatimonadetes bacterium]|nr:TolC family protein [Candidatus Hippobium faecium]
MKLICKILLLLVFASVIYAQETVDLDKSIDIAIADSPMIKVYIEQLKQAKSTIGLANASFNPTIAANAEYTRRGPKIENGGNVVSPDEAADGGVTVTLPVDIGGTMKIYKDGAMSMYKSGEYDLLTGIYNLIESVKSNYLMVLLYKENIDTAQSAFNLSKEYLEKVKQEVEAGTKANFDITRQEFDLATRQNALVDAQGTYNQAVNNFNNVLGKEDNFVTPAPLSDINVANVNMDSDLLNYAFENRTDLKKALQDQNTADLYLLDAKKSNNPKLNIIGSYNHLFVNQTETKKDTWSATANFSVPIFDGGIQKRNVEIQQSKLDAQKSQVEAIKQSIITGVLNSRLSVTTALSQIETCKSSVKLAEEAYDIAKLRYESNLGTYLDVQSALDSLVSAKNSLTAAKYSYAISLCSLEKQIASTEKVYDYANIIIDEVNKGKSDKKGAE